MKKFFALTIAGLLLLVAATTADQSKADSLTSVSVTLSNPRLSFSGGLAAGNTVGSSIITINTTPGAFPSTSSAQLVQGDVLTIGDAGTMSNYTIASTSSESTLSLTAALGAGDADTGDAVIGTQSANHVVRFTTANAIANGRFRILVPALADNTNSADGLPDSGYFDMSATPPTVTCPANNDTTYDFVTGTATASNITISGKDYHVFECAYSGTGAVGTQFDNTVGTSDGAIQIAGLINPAPKADHHTGIADTYNILIQHLNSSFNTVDSTSVGIAAIEAVKITASVPAQINFKIIGVAFGQSHCGVATDVTTTATTVPFGELPLDDFTDAAQQLSVTTNAANGYSVTAIANDQLGRNGGTCTGDPTASVSPAAISDPNCIPDSVGDDGVMTHAAFDGLDSTTIKGLAYSMDNSAGAVANGSGPAFTYDQNSGECTGNSYCARQFADAENSQVAQEIYGSNTVGDNEFLSVCYRIIPSTMNAAGNYENYITYTATATF